MSALGATCIGCKGLSKSFSINPYVIKSKTKQPNKKNPKKAPQTNNNNNNPPKQKKKKKETTQNKTKNPNQQQKQTNKIKIPGESEIVLNLSGALGGTISM